MKKISSILTLVSLLLTMDCYGNAQTTPFTFQFNNPDGTPQTNVAVMQPWPPATAQVTIVGTNIVWAATNVYLYPNSNGAGTNSVMANNYFVQIAAYNIGFFVSIPAWTNGMPTNALAMYAVNTPVIYTPGSFYSLITNALGGALVLSNYNSVVGALGYAPAAGTYGGITNLLGYQPATNSYSGIVAALNYQPQTNGYVALTNALGYTPATNTEAGILAALTYVPASNTLAGITFSQGYQSATNTTTGINYLIGYTPVPNSYSGITNALTFAPATNNYNGILFALGFQPATNTLMGISNALGYIPAQQSAVLLNSNIFFLDGNTNIGTLFVTNSTIQGVLAP